MKLFKKKTPSAQAPEIVSAGRYHALSTRLPPAVEPFEKELYDRLRYAVPVIDAALMKIIRLTGGFRVICSDERYQEELDSFMENVPVGIAGRSIGFFTDNFLSNFFIVSSDNFDLINVFYYCFLPMLYSSINFLFLNVN